MKYNSKKFGLNLMVQRKTNDMPQGLLAQKINKTVKTISNWEIGKNNPSFQDLADLAEELNCNPLYLLKDCYEEEE